MKLTNWMNRLFILPLLMGVILSWASGQDQNKVQSQDFGGFACDSITSSTKEIA